MTISSVQHSNPVIHIYSFFSHTVFHCVLSQDIGYSRLYWQSNWRSLVYEELLLPFCFPNFLFIYGFWQFDYLSQGELFEPILLLVCWGSGCLRSFFFLNYHKFSASFSLHILSALFSCSSSGIPICVCWISWWFLINPLGYINISSIFFISEFPLWLSSNEPD